jgi:hypothetical protein
LQRPVQDLVYDFGAISGGPLANKGPAIVPKEGLNTMNISNFMNHSDRLCYSYEKI